MNPMISAIYIPDNIYNGIQNLAYEHYMSRIIGNKLMQNQCLNDLINKYQFNETNLRSINCLKFMQTEIV